MLHAHFVGIDEVIDELCDAIAVWYLMPQVLDRPVVVNLWGMTGVGKTDLVRRLVRALHLQDRFVEIELSHTDSDDKPALVADRRREEGLLDGRPAVLLFDEVQRFRTVTPAGDPVTRTRFADFWELLSDGRLSRRGSADLEWMIASLRDQVGDVERRRAKGKRDDDEIGLWRARSLQHTLGLADSLETLDRLSHRDALGLLEQARRDKRLREPVDCSRHLIIVSGNLDEAFAMAGDTDEAHVDADIFAAHTAEIGVVEIKRALRRRFTPEQVARFGNVHLVYRSLRRTDFEQLIAREIRRLTSAAMSNFNVHVKVSTEVHELVYRNGVFPVQGVRPVLSTVGDVVATPLARLIFEAVRDGADHVHLDHDAKTAELVGTVGGRQIRTAYQGRVDRVRRRALPDRLACVAVHEAGHAIAYAALFGLAPLQLTARAAGADTDGFHYRHGVEATRDSLLDLAVVALAGGQAEELVFGTGHASSGRRADRSDATELVLDAVRRYGFAKWALDYGLDNEYATDAAVAEPHAEKLLRRQVRRCDDLLRLHRGALLALARALVTEGSLSPEHVSLLLADHGLPAEVRPEGHEWTPPYAALLATC